MEEKKIKNGSINYGKIWGEYEIYLNHSCDEWVIGSLENAKKFVEDLLKTIKEVEELKVD